MASQQGNSRIPVFKTHIALRTDWATFVHKHPVYYNDETFTGQIAVFTTQLLDGKNV